jgi:hypothetical protein
MKGSPVGVLPFLIDPGQTTRPLSAALPGKPGAPTYRRDLQAQPSRKKNYVSALFAKLGMERRTQAAAYAARIFDDKD